MGCSGGGQIGGGGTGSAIGSQFQTSFVFGVVAGKRLKSCVLELFIICFGFVFLNILVSTWSPYHLLDILFMKKKMFYTDYNSVKVAVTFQKLFLPFFPLLLDKPRWGIYVLSLWEQN